jgi:(4S)-4-hydroxy-5-phosphonooxypentane-2,3-dione isomerase
MLVHTAHLRCRPDVVDAFRARLLRHARASLEREAGCQRFDVHQALDDATLFLLIEAYDDHAALERHHTSEHFEAFRADTREWVTERTWWFWSDRLEGERA